MDREKSKCTPTLIWQRPPVFISRFQRFQNHEQSPGALSQALTFHALGAECWSFDTVSYPGGLTWRTAKQKSSVNRCSYSHALSVGRHIAALRKAFKD